MVFKQEEYNIQFTQNFKKEIAKIYWYISDILSSNNTAKKLIQNIKNKVLKLKKTPQLYMKINSSYNLTKEYGRICVNNYIIVYTIDSDEKKIYIVHIFHKKQNYFKFLD